MAGAIDTVFATLVLMQQDPIIVEVLKQPEAARDISLDVVVGMFTMAGVVLLCAALGGLLVGATFVLIRRMRDARDVHRESEHLRLRL